mmetsp:Transcript_53624/g.117400  ORF Transcript_53624/g.117400 Transcript_53624/m.117400 type:complete len:101 (+) Transcript_53624:432-734(+)
MTHEDASKHLKADLREGFLRENGVHLLEVDWALPPGMRFRPDLQGKSWCGAQDLIRLHALGLDSYDAVAYYMTATLSFKGTSWPSSIARRVAAFYPRPEA